MSNVKTRPPLVIILGSKSDIKRLEKGFATLDRLNIPYSRYIVSAHREPEKLRSLCLKIREGNTEVVIAAAGLSAALPGFVASYLDIPVIGVPLSGGESNGFESLLSIVQVPRGIGLLSSGFDSRGFINALIFSLEILSLKDKSYYKKLSALKNKFKE